MQKASDSGNLTYRADDFKEMQRLREELLKADSERNTTNEYIRRLEQQLLLNKASVFHIHSYLILLRFGFSFIYPSHPLHGNVYGRGEEVRGFLPRGPVLWQGRGARNCVKMC